MKKFFSIVALAVAAIAMVSCSKGADPEHTKAELAAAIKAESVDRLLAIADSINAMGEKADLQDQATAVVSYISAMGGMDKAGEKGSKEEQIALLKKAIAGVKNAVAIYDRINKQDAAATKAAFASLAEVKGLEDLKKDINDMEKGMKELKDNMGMLDLMVTMAEKGGLDGDAAEPEAEEPAEE